MKNIGILLSPEEKKILYAYYIATYGYSTTIAGLTIETNVRLLIDILLHNNHRGIFRILHKHKVIEQNRSKYLKIYRNLIQKLDDLQVDGTTDCYVIFTEIPKELR